MVHRNKLIKWKEGLGDQRTEESYLNTKLYLLSVCHSYKEDKPQRAHTHPLLPEPRILKKDIDRMRQLWAARHELGFSTQRLKLMLFGVLYDCLNYMNFLSVLLHMLISGKTVTGYMSSLLIPTWLQTAVDAVEMWPFSFKKKIIITFF